MATTPTITVNARTLERLTAYARYMTEWSIQASAREGWKPREPWAVEEAARALIERGALEWEKEIREETGLNAEPIAVVARAALGQNPPS